jgi:hypothetical protein
LAKSDQLMVLRHHSLLIWVSSTDSEGALTAWQFGGAVELLRVEWATQKLCHIRPVKSFNQAFSGTLFVRHKTRVRSVDS